MREERLVRNSNFFWKPLLIFAEHGLDISIVARFQVNDSQFCISTEQKNILALFGRLSRLNQLGVWSVL